MDFLTMLDVIDKQVGHLNRVPRGSNIQQWCQNLYGMVRNISQRKRLHIPSAHIQVFEQPPKDNLLCAGRTSWPLHSRPRISFFLPPVSTEEERRAWRAPYKPVKVTRKNSRRLQKELDTCAERAGQESIPVNSMPSDAFTIAMVSDDYFFRVALHECAHLIAGPYAGHDSRFTDACWLLGSIFGFDAPRWRDDGKHWLFPMSQWPCAFCNPQAAATTPAAACEVK